MRNLLLLSIMAGGLALFGMSDRAEAGHRCYRGGYFYPYSYGAYYGRPAIGFNYYRSSYYAPNYYAPRYYGPPRVGYYRPWSPYYNRGFYRSRGFSLYIGR